MVHSNQNTTDINRLKVLVKNNNPQDFRSCGFFFNLNKILGVGVFYLICHIQVFSQFSNVSILKPSEQFSQKKFKLALGLCTVSYASFSTGLYYAWYRKSPQTNFHTFNDWNEWKHMDKCGHFYSSFIQSQLIFQGSKWTGLSTKKSLLWSIGFSTLFQSTIEIMDGFSTEYGFSWTDLTANFLGMAAFTSQQIGWNEQRFQFKLSAHSINYQSKPIEIRERVRDFYGNNTLQRLLKDYNGQTYWISFHPVYAFTGQNSIWPAWLNISFGYGVDGLYGGHSNSWYNRSQVLTTLSPQTFPRTNQYFLSLDLHLRKIPVKNRILKTCFFILDIFKFPAPSLEYNSLGKTNFHWLYF